MISTIISGDLLVNLVLLGILTFLSSFGVPGALFYMVSLGALASNQTELGLVIVVAIIAAILGDICAYELAVKFSPWVSKRLERFKAYRKHGAKIRDMLDKAEFKIVFFSRFVLTGIGGIVNYITGLQRLDRKRFYMAVCSGEIIYGALFPALGYFFRETATDLTSLITDLAVILTLGVAICLLARFYMARLARKEA